MGVAVALWVRLEALRVEEMQVAVLVVVSDEGGYR